MLQNSEKVQDFGPVSALREVKKQAVLFLN